MAAQEGQIMPKSMKKMGEHTLDELAAIKEEMQDKGFNVDFQLRGIYIQAPRIAVEVSGCCGDVLVPFNSVFDIERTMIEGARKAVKTYEDWTAEGRERLRLILKHFKNQLPAAEGDTTSPDQSSV